MAIFSVNRLSAEYEVPVPGGMAFIRLRERHVEDQSTCQAMLIGPRLLVCIRGPIKDTVQEALLALQERVRWVLYRLNLVRNASPRFTYSRNYLLRIDRLTPTRRRLSLYGIHGYGWVVIPSVSDWPDQADAALMEELRVTRGALARVRLVTWDGFQTGPSLRGPFGNSVSSPLLPRNPPFRDTE